jgi:predicted methyltransferase
MIRIVPALAALLLVGCAGAPMDGAGPGSMAAATAQPGPELAAGLAAPHRTAEQRARDQYRRPAETLAFWGLRPGATVVEIGPGEGWWTEILAPYAARTGGRYVMALGTSPAADQFAARLAAKPEIYGQPARATFTAQANTLEPASADMILVARAFHNWARTDGATDRNMAAFAAALKPGGVLAVEQHRAPAGADPKAGTGYVPESYVIEAAQRAGLMLDARSELNANPKDTRDHPFGVWTLPPVRRAAQDGRTLTAEERARYDAIGESDRMTLRFRKPA